MAWLSDISREAVGKPSPNRASVIGIADDNVAGGRPETERATHAQGEVPLTRDGGPNGSVLQNRPMRCG